MSYRAIVIGGSAGSFPVVTKILSQLRPGFRVPIILCLHRLKHVREGFSEALGYKSVLPVIEPSDKQKIKPGHVYLAPSNYHLMVEHVGNAFALSTDEMVKFSRPSIDVLFQSAAYTYREKVVGILLSGANTDGVAGIACLKKRGGYTLVQDPAECTIRTMTEGAIKATEIDEVLTTEGIIKYLNQLSNVHVVG